MAFRRKRRSSFRSRAGRRRGKIRGRRRSAIRGAAVRLAGRTGIRL